MTTNAAGLRAFAAAFLLGAGCWLAAAPPVARADDRNQVELIVVGDLNPKVFSSVADLPLNSWLVTQVSGDVTVRIAAAAPWRAMKPGDIIGPSASVRSGSAGWAVLVRSEDRMAVAAGTAVDIPAETRSNLTSLFQSLGNVFYQVEKSPGRAFEVRTPYLLAGVKGTTFSVSVGASSASVSVSEGTVGVSDAAGQSSADVSARQTASVSAAAAGAGAGVQSTSASAAAGQGAGQGRGAGRH